MLAAIDFFDLYGMQDRISVITYGQPKTGDQTFCNYVDNLPFGSRYFRVVKVGDTTALMPRSIFGRYAECGNLVQYEKNGDKRVCVIGTVRDCKTRYFRLVWKENFYYQDAIGGC